MKTESGAASVVEVTSETEELENITQVTLFPWMSQPIQSCAVDSCILLIALLPEDYWLNYFPLDFKNVAQYVFNNRQNSRQVQVFRQHAATLTMNAGKVSKSGQTSIYFAFQGIMLHSQSLTGNSRYHKRIGIIIENFTSLVERLAFWKSVYFRLERDEDIIWANTTIDEREYAKCANDLHIPLVFFKNESYYMVHGVILFGNRHFKPMWFYYGESPSKNCDLLPGVYVLDALTSSVTLIQELPRSSDDELQNDLNFNISTFVKSYCVAHGLTISTVVYLNTDMSKEIFLEQNKLMTSYFKAHNITADTVKNYFKK